VLYLDADASVVHTRSRQWLGNLIDNATSKQWEVTVGREAEGPRELVYQEQGAMRLNDATFVNTGVVLVRRSAWSLAFLVAWWAKADELPQYLTSRTYDQGAFGHLVFTHGTTQRRRRPPTQQRPTAAEAAERASNANKAAWRARLGIVDETLLNNHAPGGSFKRPKAEADGNLWWCQHFKHPVCLF